MNFNVYFYCMEQEINNNNNRHRLIIWIPVFLSLAVIFGMFIGSHINRFYGNNSNVNHPAVQEKINQIIGIIESEYVDTLNLDQITEKTIYALLEQLDPHSAYIPPVDLQAVKEDMQGNFEGIGVEFNIVKDTIVVVTAISGGPSEAVGIRAGDRIVKIGNETVAGKNIKNEDVIKRLRGDKGTLVQISIKRAGSSKLLPFTIKRDQIPLYSLDAAFIIKSNVGYIKINRFSETTYDEFTAAMLKLRDEGMQKLILDLRGNPGGYLNAATEIADEFLSNNKMIVYTEGKSRKKEFYKATSTGDFENQKLIVLIDEGSASASEIVAGAVQDNDRGIIIGRRSFGKGLVQEQIEFDDGSALRLTVARYYTPTGRCIQRPYNEGVEKYYEDGNIHSNDSVPAVDTTQKFITPGGKVVYGGGGIIPDIVIPFESKGITPFLTEVISNGMVYDFAFEYADRNRANLLNSNSTYRIFADNKTAEKEIMKKFIETVKAKKISVPENEYELSYTLLRDRIMAVIARNLWNNEAFFYIFYQNDNDVNKALNEIGK